jgi:hypothetical protein
MGAYTELVDFTFTANETSRTFSGLSIGKGDFIRFVVTAVNPAGSSTNYRLLANSTTNTNYHTQELGGFSTTVYAARSNQNVIGANRTGETNLMSGFIKISENDKVNIFTNEFLALLSDVNNLFKYITQSGGTSTSSITSLTLEASQTNGIGTGSRIQIYRLDAEKVADITTTENATQVDISSLSIGKDSEYLLVSTIVSNNNNFSNQLFINDNTTATNYYNQRIYGNGSSAIADRNNTADFNTVGGTGATSVGYAFIKLSEIGAYTVQSYYNRLTSSSIWASNRFISSTAENITSITKLNIKAEGTNGIGSGSRFELYKLK